MLEILSEENGVVIKKLSYRKILLEYKIPVFGTNTKMLINTLVFKIRYAKNEEGRVGISGSRIPDYILITHVERCLRYISQKFGVKMKNCHILTTNDRIYEIEGKASLLDFFITSFHINDATFERELKLKKILNNE